MVGVANKDHILTFDIGKGDTPVLTVAKRKDGELTVKKVLYGEEAEKEFKIMKDIFKRRIK